MADINSLKLADLASNNLTDIDDSFFANFPNNGKIYIQHNQILHLPAVSEIVPVGYDFVHFVLQGQSNCQVIPQILLSQLGMI